MSPTTLAVYICLDVEAGLIYYVQKTSPTTITPQLHQDNDICFTRPNSQGLFSFQVLLIIGLLNSFHSPELTNAWPT